MQIVRELPLRYDKMLRNHLVQGADQVHYTVSTVRLYDYEISDGRANYETRVTQTDADGQFKKLVQLLCKRTPDKDVALKNHQDVLDKFDEMFELKPPPPKPAPAPPAAKPGAVAAPPAQGKK
ncbi:MAG: hypothetical protein HYZ53_22150 [Planctomycetes bacterium]|nr:hypothetical protein [Planctomycetota bacterium]